MKLRIHILQAKYLLRYNELSDDISLVLPKVTGWIEKKAKINSRIKQLTKCEQVTVLGNEILKTECKAPMQKI